MERRRETLVSSVEHTFDCLVSNVALELQNRASQKEDNQRFVVAIGGYITLGKTTLANRLADSLGNAVIFPTDSFQLVRATKRTLGLTGDEPDAIDFDILLNNLRNLFDGRPAIIRPYSHTLGTYQEEPIELTPAKFIIVEGVASLYPPIQEYLDLSFFLNAEDVTVYELAKVIFTSERNYSESDFDKFWNFYKSRHNFFNDQRREYSEILIDVSLNRHYKSGIIKSCLDQG